MITLVHNFWPKSLSGPNNGPKRSSDKPVLTRSSDSKDCSIVISFSLSSSTCLLYCDESPAAPDVALLDGAGRADVVDDADVFIVVGFRVVIFGAVTPPGLDFPTFDGAPTWARAWAPSYSSP